MFFRLTAFFNFILNFPLQKFATEQPVSKIVSEKKYASLFLNFFFKPRTLCSSCIKRFYARESLKRIF
jgi:hypothetical protein